MDFKIRLKQLREEKQLTQTELGKILNLSKQSISSYENGGSFPPQDMLEKLINYFNVTSDYLLGRTDIKNHESLSIDNDFAASVTKIFNNEDEFIKNMFIEMSKWTAEDREIIKKAIEIIKKSTF